MSLLVECYSFKMRPELILVAEDHPINQQVALLLLRNLGFEAHVAENGSQVIERVKCSPYSLIFMDCQMPDMDGFETTRQLRSLERDNGKHVPIIAMTAYAIEGSREQCLASGMDDYISKPIEPAKLRSIIDTWLPACNARTGASSIRVKPYAGSDGKGKIESRATVEKLTAKMGAPSAIKLLSMFVLHSPDDIHRIGTCVAERDAAGVIRAAHTLQGVFGTLCADHLRVLCTEMEDAAHERDWPRVSLTLKIFNQHIAELERLITDRMLPSSTEDKS